MGGSEGWAGGDGGAAQGAGGAGALVHVSRRRVADGEATPGCLSALRRHSAPPRPYGTPPGQPGPATALRPSPRTTSVSHLRAARARPASADKKEQSDYFEPSVVVRVRPVAIRSTAPKYSESDHLRRPPRPAPRRRCPALLRGRANGAGRGRRGQFRFRPDGASAAGTGRGGGVCASDCECACVPRCGACLGHTLGVPGRRRGPGDGERLGLNRIGQGITSRMQIEGIGECCKNGLVRSPAGKGQAASLPRQRPRARGRPRLPPAGPAKGKATGLRAGRGLACSLPRAARHRGDAAMPCE